MSKRALSILLPAIAIAIGCNARPRSGFTGVTNKKPPVSTAGSGLPCEIETLLAERCQACHGSPPVAAPVSLVSRDDLMRAALADPSKTDAEISVVYMRGHYMPPAPAATVSEREIASVESWIAAGYPESTCNAPDAGFETDAGFDDAGAPNDAGEPYDSGVTPDSGSGGVLCQACQSDDDCNATGSFCIQDQLLGGACGTACAGPADCPSGFDCFQIVDGNNNLLGNNCFPTNGVSCGEIMPPPPDAGVDAGTPDSGTTSCTDSWSNYGHAFMTQHCTGCHSSYGSYSTVSANASRIRSQVSSGRMPRGSTLPSSERTRFISWIDCGLPQ